jgi:hypothetical protein
MCKCSTSANLSFYHQIFVHIKFYLLLNQSSGGGLPPLPGFDPAPRPSKLRAERQRNGREESHLDCLDGVLDLAVAVATTGSSPSRTASTCSAGGAPGRWRVSKLAAQGAAQGGGGQDRDAATSGGGEPARQRNWEETCGGEPARQRNWEEMWWKRR